ncbi:Kelch-type beta propeller [Arabidopsis suecica]|uniref:Kelch-type beta propeller n=1 Tax=Arabidopsis suecica TaxID=45249 RepID=A0A8T2GGB9_ARASU|nr:Kelch-type beta propeller [Arabidopsis suecica]
MAIISETSDDGSHGGVPNKKPEELHKNPKEDDHQEEEVENHPPIPRQIPQALIRRTVALIKRCHYPSLSLLSKAFRIVISSPELHQTRSSLNLTEPVLYALIGFPPHSFPNWFILNPNITRNIPLRLSAIGSLPPMNPGSAVVTIGYKMYVIGGLIGPNNPVKTVFVIDCRVHTCNYLPTMHRARYRAVAEVINGKIYVIGGCEKRYDDWIEVFDVVTGIWSTVPDRSHFMSSLPGGGFVTSVVMQNKIYILDATCGLVYDPIDGTWESGELGTTLKSYWYKPCCVIEDLLYSFDPYCLQGSPINVYDPNVMVWTPMMGTGIRAFPDLDYFECKMANFGGKLMVFGATYNNPVTDTWCIEMALIKGETGPILGMIDSMVPVLRSVYSPYIDLCRSVTF